MENEHIAAAAAVLAREALVTAFGHVSVRLGEHALAITPPAPLNTVSSKTNLIEVPLDSVTLPKGAPGETWIHLAIYNARSDVNAIARAQPPSSHPAGASSDSISPIHGQGAWIGAQLPIHSDARLVRSQAAGQAVARALGNARAVLLRGNGAVTVGSDPREAATLQWVVEQTCAHVLRAAAIPTRALNADELSAWHNTWPELWPRLWAFLSPDHLSANQ